ncbi:hypothetical protein A2961_00380 [Candidatus Woesebacteria bacterium RIFCSPLOWO2_01_FULL_39_21]|uniref:Glycogen phosphorylase n=1 Tax=Candidatus Woesebacteria bacterium RIFCSPLOWO2_01_FULL_39_21 TaxID=1802519 RepID=A0A1F8BLL8_9BACT|nr:MAG: hypothetical protein A2691_04815 [Candidatus Woesebacteria bacterium RIFCSPHIGHO2_01_FULL_39_23]OGM64235.1 MAG: hypothetical protein A2961_00380 [Candidatus Woesebacteria bacterium RIFCSPLOWO2_01_FULL_39_21]
MPSNIDSPIAYFCAEFAIDSKIPTYAGGLGVLAGDLMKGAAEVDFPLIGIGLLYKGKYFNQKITEEGLQVEENAGYDPETSLTLRRVTVKGKPLNIEIELDEKFYVTAYQIRLGERTLLYLLTTDIEENSDVWRVALDSDYCCGADVELRQQMILGLGGVRLLKSIGVNPSFYHFNEGRPCFAAWEIAKLLMIDLKINFEAALLAAKQKIVYTNHTLQESGNLIYDLDLVKSYAEKYSRFVKVKPEILIKDGVEEDKKGFGITRFALSVSKKASAVSKLHFEFCKDYWKEFDWTYVTNGVHFGTWQREKFRGGSIGDAEIWDYHAKLKDSLLREVIERTGYGYDTKKLVIGWARRIADYKRFEGIFENVERLKQIIKNDGRPIQILMAGKAHVGDRYGIESIRRIIELMKGELSGNAIFVPNYDLELARKMVAGVDVWLNTPVVGKEACGTSGMKALANGVINLTTNDGWVSEVDLTSCGWIIDDNNLSGSFCDIVEREIGQIFFERDKDGLPLNWINRMRKSIELSKRFDIREVLNQYKQKLYL